MTKKLPRITGRQLLAALATLGFEVVRIRGSHHFVRNGAGLTTIVPVHAEATWEAEIARRVNALDTGEVETVPWSYARQRVLRGK